MKKIVFPLFVFLIVLASCDKDEPNNNSDSILAKANISGHVSLFDEFGKIVSNERMMISMEGGGQTFWAESEKDGSFLVPNVLYFNNYTTIYEKDGFGTYKSFGFNHQYTGAEGNLSSVNLSMKSTAYCSSLLVSQSNDTTHFHLSLAGGSDAGKRRIRLLFHTIEQISNETFSHYTPKFQANNPQPTISLSKDYLLNEVGLISGETYFVQAYGDSYYSNSFFDEYQQKRALPNLGMSDDISVPTSSFVMP